MEWFLYGIGTLWLLAGICYILSPDSSRLVFTKTAEVFNHRVAAVIAAVFGLLLLISSPHSGCLGFYLGLGGLALLKGILFWFNPQQVYEKIIQWHRPDTSDFFFKLLGIFMLLLGAAVIFLV